MRSYGTFLLRRVGSAVVACGLARDIRYPGKVGIAAKFVIFSLSVFISTYIHTLIVLRIDAQPYWVKMAVMTRYLLLALSALASVDALNKALRIGSGGRTAQDFDREVRFHQRERVTEYTSNIAKSSHRLSY